MFRFIKFTSLEAFSLVGECSIMSELSESPLQEDNLADLNGNSNGIHWDEQILTAALPPYKPVIQDDEPFKPQNFYTCPICHDRYLLPSSLDFHMKRRSLQIKYHCQNCNRFITDYNRCSFLNHLQQHSDSGGYLTDTLQVTVTPLAEDQLRTDQQTSENKDSIQNFSLKTSSTVAVEHNKNNSQSEITTNEAVAVHTEEQAHQRTNSEESLYTTSVGAIKVSTKSLTMPEVCKECGMKLLIDLRSHFLRPHCYVDPGLECQQCKLILPSVCSLRAHKRYHEKSRPHTCPECGRIFSLWASFLVHLNYSCFHLSRCIRFRCPKCATLFYSVELLERHYFSDHIKTVFKCDLCPIACFDTASVDQHKAIAHINKDVKTLQFQQCQICPDRLTPKEQIAGHVLEHTRSKKCLAFGFECNVCKNFFQQKAVFGAHQCNGPPAVGDGTQSSDSQGDNTTASASDTSIDNAGREGDKNTSVSSATDCVNSSDNSHSINNLETTADNADENNWNNTTSVSSQRTDMPKCLPIKFLTRSFPVKKLSSPKNIQPTAASQIEKPPIRQYGNNKLGNITVNTNGSRVISAKHFAFTQDLKKNTVIRNILPAQTAVRSNLGSEGGVLKVHKVIRSCSSCKSEIVFHSPSLEQVSMLPSKCYNCLKKHNVLSSSGSFFASGTKTVVHLQKTHSPNKTITVVSAPKLVASSVSGTVTTTQATTVIPTTRQLKTLSNEVTEKLQETKESARFAFNGPHSSSDSKAPSGQFKCHICKKLINIQSNDIQEHFSKEHKNIEIRTLTPLLKKINIEQSQNGKELGTIIKTEPEDFDSLETPLNTSSGEKSETSEPPKKKKKAKLGSKDKLPPPVTPFSSGKLIFPVIKKEDNRYECFKCQFSHVDKTEFESHILLHKTDSSSFQCMECGMCFIVQPSFEKHLLVYHGIKDVEKYVTENLNCKQDSYDPYNGFSPVTVSSDDDADEHKCSVCHDSFETSEELDKHFRVHGMAFLLKKQRELRQIITA